jgi:uncharacterized surface protein with fasciclin (FAS1) repeats
MKQNILKNLAAVGGDANRRMRKQNFTFRQFLKSGTIPLWFVALILVSTSCNKALPDATPILYPPANNSTTSIGELINTDTTYSIFKQAAAKYQAAANVNLIAQLSDTTKVFTAFIPNNAAFRASGFPNWDAVNAFIPLTSLAAILQYAIIPGEQYTSDNVPATFPNIQLPTLVNIGVLPSPAPPIHVQLSTFLSKTSTAFYDNTIPVVQPDIKMRNGVIHLLGGIVAPPGMLLKDAIDTASNLTYFRAAIARADSGKTGTASLGYLLGYSLTNMTVLAPDDNAFKMLLFGVIYSTLLKQQIPAPTAFTMATEYVALPADVFFSRPELFSALTAATVRGILAYHFLASPNPVSGEYEPNIRVFSNNFSSTPAFYKTLINTDTALLARYHPGIRAEATFTGPFVTRLQFTGLGSFPPDPDPTHIYTGPPANAISKDNHAVNGIYYVIDKVLLPQ